jgi:hypothetical protein
LTCASLFLFFSKKNFESWKTPVIFNKKFCISYY